MGYTAPTTRATSNLITAAIWNTDVVENIKFLANPPACRVYHGSAQSWPSTASSAASAFNSERYDTDGMHSTVTNNSRITINTAGLYLIGGHGEFAANSSGTRFIGIRVNGSAYIAASLHDVAGTLNGYVSIATVYKFAATDYAELYFAQTSGSTLNLASAVATSPEFHATWIGLG